MMRSPRFALGMLLVLTCMSCGRRQIRSYQVVPGKPSYLLRSPEKVETPFSQTLSAYSDISQGQADLKKGMVLKIENAYFKPGAVKRGLANYLGLERVQFRVEQNGSLKRFESETLANRPTDQAAIDSYLPTSRQRQRFQRLVLQVTMNLKSGAATAILLSSKSKRQIDALTKSLILDPASVCGGRSANCTVFPESGSVSLGMDIVVNGKVTFVAWSSTVASVVGRQKEFLLFRLHRGRAVPVAIDANDPEALKLPLLPGDVVSW